MSARAEAVADWLLQKLRCPRHGGAFLASADELVCEAGCRFPVVEGTPVLLLEEAVQTIDIALASIRLARNSAASDPFFTETLGLSREEREGVLALANRGGDIDPAVSYLVAATNGIAYKSLVGSLTEYPIPEIRVPDGEGRVLVDVGCSWGRWSIAAARKGYRVIGVDPSLGAVLAARRVARQMGLDAAFIVGDARFLPLAAGSADAAFSYSVLQHLSREDATRAIAEIGRVLAPSGISLVQLPNKWGIRCLYHQLRRGFREPTAFDVRYWRLRDMRSTFRQAVGPPKVSADCYFGIGLQRSDVPLMPLHLKPVVMLSEALRAVSRAFPPLVWVADSVYVHSRKA